MPQIRALPSGIRLRAQRLGVLPSLGFWRRPEVWTSPFTTSIATLAIAGVSLSSVGAAGVAWWLSGQLRWPPPAFYALGLAVALFSVAGFIERTVRAALDDREAMRRRR